MPTHDAKVIFDKVQKLYTVIKDMGNPFMEETGGLFTLHTTIIAHPKPWHHELAFLLVQIAVWRD
jgi:hypothetical protein